MSGFLPYMVLPSSHCPGFVHPAAVVRCGLLLCWLDSDSFSSCAVVFSPLESWEYNVYWPRTAGCCCCCLEAVTLALIHCVLLFFRKTRFDWWRSKKVSCCSAPCSCIVTAGCSLTATPSTSESQSICAGTMCGSHRCTLPMRSQWKALERGGPCHNRHRDKGHSLRGLH